MRRKVLSAFGCIATILSLRVICASEPAGEETGEKGIRLHENITLTGLIELETYIEDNEDTDSDITLATAQVGLSADINDRLSADLVFLWEEDDTEPVDIDEAYITSSFGEWTIRAGKLYVPFGAFENHFVSDPMTLELGETRETALDVSYAHGPFEAGIAVFNGEVAINGGNDDSINNIVAAVRLSPMENFSIGASWTRNIADSDGLEGEFPSPGEIDGAVPGLAVFVSLSIERFKLETEYIAALSDFEAAELDSDGDGDGDKPTAFDAEAAYAVKENMEAALKYEVSGEFLDFPESRFGVCFSWQIVEYIAFSFELVHSAFDDDISDDDTTMFITRFSVEF